MVDLSRLSLSGAYHVFTGWQKRIETEDTNKVVRDAHRVIPGFSRTMERNLRSMKLKRAFEQSVADVLLMENPKLFGGKPAVKQFGKQFGKPFGKPSVKSKKAPAIKLAA